MAVAGDGAHRVDQLPRGGADVHGEDRRRRDARDARRARAVAGRLGQRVGGGLLAGRLDGGEEEAHLARHVDVRRVAEHDGVESLFHDAVAWVAAHAFVHPHLGGQAEAEASVR